MITFVTTHFDLSPELVSTLPDISKEPQEYNQPSRLIETLFLSAELFHSGCGAVVLTDQKSTFALAPNRTLFRISNLDIHQVILARLEAQISFLELCDGTSDLVFLDYDILINGSLTAVFEDFFDIGLTYRSHKQWPFNGAVFFVKAERTQAACRFLKELHSLLKKLHPSLSKWWGDQVALMAFIGYDAFYQRQSEKIIIKGYLIHCFKCRLYNRSFLPGKVIDQAPSSKILHFKGNRKKMLWDYWNRFLLPQIKAPQ